MARSEIETLLAMLDGSFAASGQHGLLANLRDVRDGDLHALPAGGARSIFDILEHVGECKFVYENHAFGDGSMNWDRPETMRGISRQASKDDIIAWLREGQRLFRERVAALADDTELTKPRKASWGKEYETRWHIGVIIQHDLYHGGEINHLRSLLQGEDRWAHELD